MDSNSQLKEAYQTLHEEVVSTVNAADVLDHLFAAKVMPAAKLEEWNGISDGTRRARSLMTFLHIVGHPEAFIKLHEAIKRQVSYEWLVREIDNICRQQKIDPVERNDPGETTD
jgi:hypothetical protein